MSHWRVCCLVGLATLACARAAVAGTATFAGLGDEVRLEAKGLTKVEATADGYTITGGSTSFTDDCTGAQGDHVAIHETVISQLNHDISDAFNEAPDVNWEITLQLDSNSAALDPGSFFTPGSSQAWGVGMRFGNGTNQSTNPTPQEGTLSNFGRGADLIFGFTNSAVGDVTFPRLVPYVLLVGADFSRSAHSNFFNLFHAVDLSFEPTQSGYFQDFLGTDGKLVLRRTGLDEFGRPIIEIHSEGEGKTNSWAWTLGDTGTPGPPLVHATGEQITNVNFNGLVPAESALPDSEAPLGMPVTSLYLFVENETTWEQYFEVSFPSQCIHFFDECFGTQPTPEQSETYAIDFDFPVDDPGEFDSTDTEGFQALLTGPRDDINSYGNVDEQRTLPEGAGRFGCLTIVSDAIPDINPKSRCPGAPNVAAAWVDYE